MLSISIQIYARNQLSHRCFMQTFISLCSLSSSVVELELVKLYASFWITWPPGTCTNAVERCTTEKRRSWR
jgi:hypothetical protein